MRRLLILAVLAAACSEPSETEPAEDIVETPEEEVEREETPPDETEGAPPSAPTVLELPEEIPVPEQLRVEAAEAENDDLVTRQWPVIHHPDPGVRTVLASTLEGVAGEIANAAEVATCTADLAHESLVSVACSGVYDIRGGISHTTAEIHLAVADGRVRPVAAAEAFLPDTELYRLVRARCEASPPNDNEFDGPVCDAAQITFGPRGIVGTFYDYYDAPPRRVVVPYEELRGRIRSDGPLAPVLGGGAARFPEATEENATGWAVTDFGTEPALVRRWMDADDLPDVSLVVDDFGGGLARLVLPGRDAAVATLAATALGTQATPIDLGRNAGRMLRFDLDSYEGLDTHEREALALRWVRTTEDLNLRPRGWTSRSDRQRVLAVLPAGSLVAAVGGQLRQRGQSVLVMTAFGPGSLASRHLRAHDACTIGPGETSRHVASVRVRRNGRAADAWLVVSRQGRGSRVALHAVGDSECALGEELLGVDVERPAFDVRLTGTTEHGGSTLLLVGTGRGRSTPNEMRYRMWRVGTRPALLDETFEGDRSETDLAVRLGETADGTYFPLTLRTSGATRRFAWTEGALVEQAPPE